jgi:hypothetical protein
MILLDTDTVSLYHAGHENVVERVEKVDPAEVLGTTVITRAEILRARRGARSSNWNWHAGFGRAVVRRGQKCDRGQPVSLLPITLTIRRWCVRRKAEHCPCPRPMPGNSWFAHQVQ